MRQSVEILNRTLKLNAATPWYIVRRGWLASATLICPTVKSMDAAQNFLCCSCSSSSSSLSSILPHPQSHHHPTQFTSRSPISRHVRGGWCKAVLLEIGRLLVRGCVAPYFCSSITAFIPIGTNTILLADIVERRSFISHNS